MGKLTFYEPDEENFSCLKTAKEAIRRGKLYPTLMNCANELAVQLFLEGKISFLQIAELNERVLELDGSWRGHGGEYPQCRGGSPELVLSSI